LKLLDDTQLLLIYFNVSNFTQNLNEFLVRPNFMKAVGITTRSSSLKGSVYFAIRGKKKYQNSLRLFCRLGHCFALVGNIDTTSLTRECTCILFPNNGQFFSFRDATASPASPCRTLMPLFIFCNVSHVVVSGTYLWVASISPSCA